MYVYSYGMLLASMLTDPLTNWNITLGMKVVRLVAGFSRQQGIGAWPWYDRLRPYDTLLLDQLRDKLGEEIFSKTLKEGQLMTLDEAVALALEVDASN